MRQNRKSAKQVKAKRKANGIKSTSAKRCWTIGRQYLIVQIVMTRRTIIPITMKNHESQ